MHKQPKHLTKAIAIGLAAMFCTLAAPADAAEKRKDPISEIIEIVEGLDQRLHGFIEKLESPVRSGIITSLFSKNRCIKNSLAFVCRPHLGTDVGANEGDTVLAALTGRITEVGNHREFGNFIRIESTDGTIETLSAHFQKAPRDAQGKLWKKGDHITIGDVIGTVGQSGNATGSHLHFELKINGKHVDPLKYIKSLGTLTISAKKHGPKKPKKNKRHKNSTAPTWLEQILGL